jgi:hypothetical protein
VRRRQIHSRSVRAQCWPRFSTSTTSTLARSVKRRCPRSRPLYPLEGDMDRSWRFCTAELAVRNMDDCIRPPLTRARECLWPKS